MTRSRWGTRSATCLLLCMQMLLVRQRLHTRHWELRCIRCIPAILLSTPLARALARARAFSLARARARALYVNMYIYSTLKKAKRKEEAAAAAAAEEEEEEERKGKETWWSRA